MRSTGEITQTSATTPYMLRQQTGAPARVNTLSVCMSRRSLLDYTSTTIRLILILRREQQEASPVFIRDAAVFSRLFVIHMRISRKFARMRIASVEKRICADKEGARAGVRGRGMLVFVILNFARRSTICEGGRGQQMAFSAP